MVGGTVVQVVGDVVEVLEEHSFSRSWRKLEPGTEVRVGDSLWWIGINGYLSRDGEFRDRCIGYCGPSNPHGRPAVA